MAESEVTLDMNHPLAGEELKFEIELVGVEGDKSSDDWAPSMKKVQLYHDSCLKN